MLTFKAIPLENYSSLHTLPLLSLLGIQKITSPCIKMALNFNIQSTSSPMPNQAHFHFYLRDQNALKTANDADFSIRNLTRWRLNLSQYDSFSNFLEKIKRKNYRSYRRALNVFETYGAKLTLIEGDWSTHADKAFQLYSKVARKHGAQLYDLSFFQTIAKLDPYRLLCAWYDDTIIGVLVLIDEGMAIHSMVCGLDYEHTKKSHAYSRMHYEFIRLAFDQNKYHFADIGLTADTAKSLMDFQPVTMCLDITAKNTWVKRVLRIFNRFTTTTINEESKLKLKFRLPRMRST